MAINHASCDHERTPKARAACRRAGGQSPRRRELNTDGFGDFLKEIPETSSGVRVKARPSDVMHTRRSGRYGALRALSDAPNVVRTFIALCEARGFTMNEAAVDQGFSIEVYSSRGAARVTWDGDEVAWFTRLGYTSITTRVRTVKQVWNVLGVKEKS